MAVKNLYSLGLLRNGKVYQNKQAAYQGLTQEGTNDGVAKLARYLDPVVGGNPIIRTLVGFYANASEMSDAGGGQSSYTILDIEGSAADVTELRQEVAAINAIIGNGIEGTTLTEAINDINNKLGDGFSAEHTVADALNDLKSELENKLKVEIDDTTSPSEYIIKQGGLEIGRIKKDVVVDKGSVVHGTWVDENTFIEDPEGQPHPKYNYHFKRVSCRGQSFEDRGITGATLNSFRAAMKRVADTDIILKAVTDMSDLVSYEPDSEYLIIRKNENNVSNTEGLFYCIRNAFAHGSFDITESKVYVFENWKNGNLNGTAKIREKTLLSWIDLFFLDIEEIKKAGK